MVCILHLNKAYLRKGEKKSPVSTKAYNLPWGKVPKENGAISVFLTHIIASVPLPTPLHS